MGYPFIYIRGGLDPFLINSQQIPPDLMDNHAQDKDNRSSQSDRGGADRPSPRARSSATFGVQHMPPAFWWSLANQKHQCTSETIDLMSYFVREVKTQLDASHRLL
jgi:hypothetical protein